MATKLTVKINKVGKYGKGVNIGKDYASFYIKGQINSLRITESMAEQAKDKAYMKILKLDDSDNYPTGKSDSEIKDSEGNPIYSAGEILTVGEYWKRRRASNPEVKPIELFQFDGFLSMKEEELLAQISVAKLNLVD